MGLSLRKKALFLAIACMPLSVVLADGDGVTSVSYTHLTLPTN